MKNAVYKNASIVTGISILERCLGFLYRIVLSRYIGAEGLGLYQVALSIFALFSTLATGGIPITISRMIAKCKAEGDERGEKTVITAGICLSLLIGLPLCLLLWAFGGKMPFLFSNASAFKVFRILLVGLSFSCVYAVIRGYFWGNKRFLTASLLEMIEEIAMVIAGVLFLRGSPSPLVGAERAAWALSLADILSCAAALLCFLCLGGKFGKPKAQMKSLFSASTPITAVKASGSLVNSAVAVLLPTMLIRAGLNENEAIKLFGILSGMVLPVLFIPATLIGSLALVLVPELSEDYYQNKLERLQTNVHRGLTFAFLVACALIPLFFVLGEDVGRLAFSSPTAGNIIAKSCVILLPMSLTMISTSILNSIGFEKQTFLFFFLGAAALLLGVLLLPALIGGYAYVAGLGASYVVCAFCNLLFLRKKCPLFQKGEYKEWLFGALAVLPLTLIGQFTRAMLLRVCGGPLAFLLTALIMLAFTVGGYFLLRPRKKKTST